jgi:hypothetical protein
MNLYIKYLIPEMRSFSCRSQFLYCTIVHMWYGFRTSALVEVHASAVVAVMESNPSAHVQCTTSTRMPGVREYMLSGVSRNFAENSSRGAKPSTLRGRHEGADFYFRSPNGILVERGGERRKRRSKFRGGVSYSMLWVFTPGDVPFHAWAHERWLGC